MDKKSKIMFLGFVGILFLSGILTYYRIIILRDFPVTESASIESMELVK